MLDALGFCFSQFYFLNKIGKQPLEISKRDSVKLAVQGRFVNGRESGNVLKLCIRFQMEHNVGKSPPLLQLSFYKKGNRGPNGKFFRIMICEWTTKRM
ncbi:hypothetical protein D3C75_816520 [compost metagenome]